MNGDIIAQMRIEEADLVRKLKAVRDFMAAYGVEASDQPMTESPAQASRQPSPASSPREKVGIDGYTAYGRRIVATAMLQMMTTSFPVKTRQIVEFLQNLNVEISGQDPVNAVGALLYRSADLVSHGKAGWTVADADTAREIVGKYAVKENEASEADAADASETPLDGQNGGPQE